MLKMLGGWSCNKRMQCLETELATQKENMG
jgi:hypothetical protein